MRTGRSSTPHNHLLGEAWQWPARGRSVGVLALSAHKPCAPPSGHTPHHAGLGTQRLRAKRERRRCVSISSCFLPLLPGSGALEGWMENERAGDPQLGCTTPRTISSLRRASPIQVEGGRGKAALLPVQPAASLLRLHTAPCWRLACTEPDWPQLARPPRRPSGAASGVTEQAGMESDTPISFSVLL